VAIVICQFSACGGQRYASTSNPSPVNDLGGHKRTLSPSEQESINQAFSELAAGHEPVHPPTPSDHPRWSDVPLAAVYACDEIEAAILTQTDEQDQVVFTFATVEGYRGRLVVSRVEGTEVYRTSAEIGMFGDKTERAEALCEAFDKQMRLFEKKRSLGD
jgi:hypothetical protein